MHESTSSLAVTGSYRYVKLPVTSGRSQLTITMVFAKLRRNNPKINERENDMKKLALFVILAGVSGVTMAARQLPHPELVKKYMGGPEAYGAKVASCKGHHMMLDENNLECWAAHTAKGLSAMPKDTRELVLNAPKLESARAKCLAMSMEDRFESRMCTATGQADTFISFTLPRMKLEPLKFK